MLPLELIIMSLLRLKILSLMQFATHLITCHYILYLGNERHNLSFISGSEVFSYLILNNTLYNGEIK